MGFQAAAHAQVNQPWKKIHSHEEPQPRPGKLASALSALVGVGVMVGVLVWALSSAYPPFQPSHTTTYRVQSGDTVWSVVERFAPNVNQQQADAWVERVNHIKDGEIVPNQLLVVPEG